MKKENTSIRLNQLMSSRNLRQVDILELCKPFCLKYNVKLGKNDLSQYVSGKVEPGQKKLTILGMALNVNEAWLMGYDVPMNRNDSSEIRFLQRTNTYNYTFQKKSLEARLLNTFSELTIENKNKVVGYASKILELQTFEEPILNAAHERTDIDITEEMKKTDEDIMDDENF